ncbi:MAG: ROK family protein, partial [Actinomyces sp.]
LGGGVGACVIVADRIGGGSTGYAGELGHITVPGGQRPCQCGKNGCLETLASAPAVTEIAGAADLEDLRRMLDAHAPDAVSALAEASRAVAQACAMAVLLMSPSRIVLGGELVTACPELVPQIAADIAGRLVPGTSWGVEVVAARLDGLGCAQGAAAAADSYVTACLEEAKRHQRSYA